MKKKEKKMRKIEKDLSGNIKKNKPSISFLSSYFLDQIKIKRKTLSKREEVLLGVLVLTTCGVLGYYGFINGPQSARKSIIKALNQTQTKVAEAKSSNSNLVETSPGKVYMESEVENIVNNFISKDPNVAIVGEEFQEKNQSQAILKLSIDHVGTSGELAQFLESFEDLDKFILVDKLDYQKDLTGKETTSLSIEIPYMIEDGSLKTKSFMVPEENLTTVTSPAPKNVPKTKSIPTNKVSGVNGSLSSTPKKVNKNVVSSNEVTSSNKNTLNKNSTKTSSNNQELVKPASKLPSREPDTKYRSPELMQYSIIDTFTSIYSMDGLSLEITDYNGEQLDLSKNREGQNTNKDVEIAIIDKKNGDAEVERPEVNSNDSLELSKEWLKVEFSTFRENFVSQNSDDLEVADLDIRDEEEGKIKNTEKQSINEVHREIAFNTGGVYLPKNGREVSFDIVLPTTTNGKFELLLANPEGKTQIIKESRRVDLQDGYYRIFFTLPQMNGNIRASEFRYKFLDNKEVRDELIFRNFQILSNK